MSSAKAVSGNSRKCLPVEAKIIVKSVYLKLVERGHEKHFSLKETSTLTGVPQSTVWKIVNNTVKPRKVRKDSGAPKSVDLCNEDLIRRKIYQMYEEQKVPTLLSLSARLSEDDCDISCSTTTLWRTLRRLGFLFKKIDKRQVIMESHRLQQLRIQYLEKINKARSENRTIIYLDETWYDTHDTPSKGWTDKSKKCHTKAPSNKGKRITILHAGSEDGWVPNCLFLAAKNISDSSLDYHCDTTAEVFEDWFQNKLLPNIPPKSSIVMDNASYHSRQLNKVPSSTSRKKEIQDFLSDRDIYFHESYNVKQLLELLKCYNFKKEYVCDKIAEVAGHEIIRLPPYYCIFNPIELIWHKLKSNIRAHNNTPTLNPSVIVLIKTEVENVTVENWRNCTEHVKKIENSYRSMYININSLEPVKRIIINLEDSCDSEIDLE